MFFYCGRSAALRSVPLFRLRASSFLRAQKGTKDALKNPWFLRISFYGDLEAGTAPIGASKIEWTLSRLLPPPGGGRFPGAPDGGAPHPGVGLGYAAKKRDSVPDS